MQISINFNRKILYIKVFSFFRASTASKHKYLLLVISIYSFYFDFICVPYVLFTHVINYIKQSVCSPIGTNHIQYKRKLLFTSQRYMCEYMYKMFVGHWQWQWVASDIFSSAEECNLHCTRTVLSLYAIWKEEKSPLRLYVIVCVLWIQLLIYNY